MRETQWWIMEDKIIKSKNAAKFLLRKIEYKGERMVDTQQVIAQIEKVKAVDIKIILRPFSKTAEPLKQCGAFIEILKEKDKIPTARIFVNTDWELKFQRFSLAHELGHLMLADINHLENGKIIVSPHISYNLNSISKEQYKDDIHLQEEQLANAFAMELLLPSSDFLDVLLNEGVKGAADFFGVTEEAIESRLDFYGDII